MTLGLAFLFIKIVSLHIQECGCSSELLRHNTSNADAGIEIESISVTLRNMLVLHYCHCELGLNI